MTKREQVACKVLAKLKHDGTNFTDCHWNDCLLNFVDRVLRVNPYRLFEKVIKHIDNN